jgi:hypothetical protein
LTIEQRAQLAAVMRKRHGNAALARRAQWVVLWNDRERRFDIRSKLAGNDEFVSIALQCAKKSVVALPNRLSRCSTMASWRLALGRRVRSSTKCPSVTLCCVFR